MFDFPVMCNSVKITIELFFPSTWHTNIEQLVLYFLSTKTFRVGKMKNSENCITKNSCNSSAYNVRHWGMYRHFNKIGALREMDWKKKILLNDLSVLAKERRLAEDIFSVTTDSLKLSWL